MIQVHVVPIDRIKPNPRNARTHSRKQVGEIADSIKAVGWTVPILIDEQQRLIAGHGRLEAAKTLGLKTVPTIMLRGLSDAKRRALALADNKIAENAGWDRELLAAELPELTELLIEEGLDISLTGFLPVEIDQLTVDFEDNAADPGDEVDPAWLKADPVCTENSNACVLMVQTTENSP